MKNERKENDVNEVFHPSPQFFFPLQIREKIRDKMTMRIKSQN